MDSPVNMMLNPHPIDDEMELIGEKSCKDINNLTHNNRIDNNNRNSESPDSVPLNLAFPVPNLTTLTPPPIEENQNGEQRRENDEIEDNRLEVDNCTPPSSRASNDTPPVMCEAGSSGLNAIGVVEEPTDLEELERFAKLFRQKRIKLGFTQGDVGAAMGRQYGNDFSQTTISRFEALNLSFKNMCKLKVMLERWLLETETSIANGTFTAEALTEQSKSEANSPADQRKRRKRTSIEIGHKKQLEQEFKNNPRPTHEQIDALAVTLCMDREVVRIWFCNRRQKEKRLQSLHDELGLGAGGVTPGLMLYTHSSLVANSAGIPSLVQVKMPPEDDDVSDRSSPSGVIVSAEQR